MNTKALETFNLLRECEIKRLTDLEGFCLTRVSNINNEELHFYLADNWYLRMYHQQDCCEEVIIDDIVGNLDDLVGVPLLLAEEVTNVDPPSDKTDYYYRDENETWTFYRFRTIKGSVDIRWYGTSNGYYSESVDLAIFKSGKLKEI